MTIRIHAQSIYTPQHPHYGVEGYAAINSGILRAYAKVLRPDTVVEPRFLPRSTWYTSHAYLEMLNNAEIVRGIVDAEAAGFDVAFIRCGNDPAIREARESVRFPVVAMTESAMHLACQLGSRFALIGVDEKSGPLVERNLRAYGLEGRAIARRPYRIPRDPRWNDLLGESPRWFESADFVHEKIVPAFEEAAQECIDEGAEVIVTACALYASLTLAGYNTIGGTTVPVVESVAVGIKNAEMQGELYRSLGLSTSKHLTYQSYLTAEMRDRLTADFFPPEAEPKSLSQRRVA